MKMLNNLNQVLVVRKDSMFKDKEQMLSTGAYVEWYLTMKVHKMVQLGVTKLVVRLSG